MGEEMNKEKARINGELQSIAEYYDLNNWEEVPDEDLWEDGEISNNTCMIKIYNNVVVDGEWRIIRRKDD